MQYGERFRPQYHFSAPKGWLNDPNGLVFFEGEYHLFYQYNPEDLCWGAPHWGHAVSTDMLHWKNLPVALSPDELGTIFSGTIVADVENSSGLFNGRGGLVALFTHHGADGTECQSLAYSADRGRSWRKYAGNPVLRGKDDPDWKDFRDPKVLRWNGRWLMLVGGGRYRFFVSDDLIHWDYLADMALFEEFPDLFQVDGCWILNVNGYAYYVGEMTARGFLPRQEPLPEDFANSWQACYSYENMPGDRRVWLAWMRDSGKGPTAPWRCNLSIPRETRLKETTRGKKLLQYPIAEVENLRRECFRLDDVPMEQADLSSLRGTRLDIEMVVRREGDEPFGIRCFSNGKRWAEIGCRPQERMVYVDTVKASSPEFDDASTMFSERMSMHGNQTAILARRFSCYHPAGETVKLRLLLDGSTLEVFFDDGEAVATTNVYPGDDADGLELFGAKARLCSLRIWRMASVWENEAL